MNIPIKEWEEHKKGYEGKPLGETLESYFREKRRRIAKQGGYMKTKVIHCKLSKNNIETMERFCKAFDITNEATGQTVTNKSLLYVYIFMFLIRKHEVLYLGDVVKMPSKIYHYLNAMYKEDVDLVSKVPEGDTGFSARIDEDLHDSILLVLKELGSKSMTNVIKAFLNHLEDYMKRTKTWL